MRVQQELETWESVEETDAPHPWEKTLYALEDKAEKLMAAFDKQDSPEKQMDILNALKAIQQKVEAGRQALLE